MFERAVTAAYILANPDQADAFLEYDKVNTHKAYMHAKKLGEHGPRLTAETIKRIEDEFEAVKPMFLSGTRVRGSWTALDTASLAQKAGPGYEVLYLDAFYKPTLEIHTTAAWYSGDWSSTKRASCHLRAAPREPRRATLS